MAQKSLEHIKKVQSKLIGIGYTRVINPRIVDDNDDKCVEDFEWDIRRMLKDSNFFDLAPFKWINMCYDYSIETGAIRLHGISKQYLDLGTTIELQYDEVEYYSWNDVPKLRQLMEASMLDMIIFVGKKYNLPTALFEKRYKEIGGYPELPENYQDKLPPSANRPNAEDVESWMEARDSARKTSRVKRGRDPRGRIALKPIPKYEQFQKKQYRA